jgi:hypothetical protein
VRETDDLLATVLRGGGAGSTSQFAHLHSALHACRNLMHLWAIVIYQVMSALVLMRVLIYFECCVR